MNGILIVDKPAGWTSQDVAAKLRGALHEKRVGHGGTLDPMATGVLPVFVGRATRAVEFFESAEKEYIAALRLGIVTDTQDTEGTVLSQSDATVTREQLEAVLPRFTGVQQQTPPMYSAVKIGGKKLYELARQGKEIERAPRTIEIKALTLLGEDGGDFILRVRCSKGTYIRTLCHDIGRALGCGGCMSRLRRTAAGCFTEAQSIPLDELLTADDPASLLLPTDSLFAALPALTLEQHQEKLCRNGNVIPLRTELRGLCRVYAESGEFLMLGRLERDELRTVKSFFEVN
ncbi:MAG: tRNA pseudouridine(55) synthase TruB [Oscillospiraceae bacterium]|nr:tRNA pseudouridine(55) synthase TruB [Oscillospiraceae bacterium]